MKKIITFLFAIICNINVFSQENIFSWSDELVVPNPQYMPLLWTEINDTSSDPTYTINNAILKTPDGKDSYSLKFISYDNSNYGETPPPYDYFILSQNGKIVLKAESGNPMQTVACQTMDKSNAYYLQIPLEDKAFALLLGGWYYGYGEAPEMKIIVVKNGKAKIVFDNYAYAYKYQAPPAFSMEFVDDVTWNEDHFELSGDYQIPSAAALKTRTKHKIWREGNMLKYKSWK